MRAKMIVAATLLAATAGSAMAAKVVVQKPGVVTITNHAAALGSTPLKSGPVQFIGGVGYTAFTDVYTFSAPDAHDSIAASFNQTVNAGKNIDFTSISLVGGGHTYNFAMTSPDKIAEVWTLPTSIRLDHGVTYSFNVSGITTGSATYAGNLHVTAVPEPETYGMLLAGLGMLGLLARRRKAG